MKVVFSREAKSGLRDIANFIARDNRERAVTFVDELRAKALAIVETPYAFPIVGRYQPRACGGGWFEIISSSTR